VKTEPTTTEAPFDPLAIDPDAVDVVSHLQSEGYVTYLVGGCVRDLLLDLSPKDFDIATTASPEECKAVFGRRCRLIGRRFKLAHIRSGREIFEVATFRGRPEDQDADTEGFVVRANTYGSPAEDAASRDFTINGLFYDPVAHLIHDFVDGRRDVDRRLVRTIGDAEQRFREDPVRILRAIKFSGRIGLELDEPIRIAAAEVAPHIHDCPVARVTEELFRLVESGHAARTLSVMRELNVLQIVLPEIHEALGAVEELWPEWEAWLGQMDRQVRAHGALPRDSIFTLLIWPVIWARLQANEAPEHIDWGALAFQTILAGALRMSLPVRHRHTLKMTANVLRRLLYPTKRQRRAPILRSPALPLALTILRMRHVLGDTSVAPIYEHWASGLEEANIWAAPAAPRKLEPNPRDGRGGRRR
jgi:poly(A) polymerase